MGAIIEGKGAGQVNVGIVVIAQLEVRADIGFAMGAAGTATALETADVAIMVLSK